MLICALGCTVVETGRSSPFCFISLFLASTAPPSFRAKRVDDSAATQNKAYSTPRSRIDTAQSSHYGRALQIYEHLEESGQASGSYPWCAETFVEGIPFMPDEGRKDLDS